MIKVKFLGASQIQINWGNNDDPNKECRVGEIYEVVNTEEHSWHTKIRLFGIEGQFNNASFEYIEVACDGETLLIAGKQIKIKPNSVLFSKGYGTRAGSENAPDNAVCKNCDQIRLTHGSKSNTCQSFEIKALES